MREPKENLIKKTKEYSSKQMKAMDKFYKTHCLNNSDTLSIILKTHLYIEKCLNEMLIMNLPTPKNILNKTFSQKLDIFEALNLGFPPGNGFIESKLKVINKIRNSFAHNLDKQLTEKEFKELSSGLRTSNYTNSLSSLKSILINIIGYLHALIAVNHFYPFMNSYRRNKKVLERDLFWTDTISVFYPFKDAYESMDFLKIESTKNHK